ncbi:MAG: hypothetical protein ACRENE_02600, partial [Polyangiaceae bacterium]
MGSVDRARGRALRCAVSCILFFAPAARGDTREATAAAPSRDDAPPRVDLAVVGETPATRDLGGRIGSWFKAPTVVRSTGLARLEASSVFAPTGEPGVRVWVVQLSTSSAHIVFAVEQGAGKPPRYLVDDMDLPHGLDELAIEQLAQVVSMSAMALWAGTVESSRHDVEVILQPAQVGAAPAPPATSPAPPAPAAPDETAAAARDTQTMVRTGLEYTVRDAGDEGALQTVGASVGLAHRGATLDLGVNLRGSVILPEQPSKAGIHLDVRGVGVALGLAAARRVGGGVSIGGEIGPGIEVVQYQVNSVDDASLVPSDGGVNPRPVLSARAGLQADLGSLSLTVDA